MHFQERMRVSDVIRRQQDDIVVEWAGEAREQVPQAAEVPPLVLLNHMPALLEEMARWLDSDDPAARREVEGQARRHGGQRLARDFDLREVVHEYRILRRVILRRVMGAFEELDDGEREVVRTNDALDQAVTEAVDRFTEGRARPSRAEPPLIP